MINGVEGNHMLAKTPGILLELLLSKEMDVVSMGEINLVVVARVTLYLTKETCPKKAETRRISIGSSSIV